MQGWMKPGREDLAPNVALISSRFNEVQRAENEFKCRFSFVFFGGVRCVDWW